MWKDLIAKIMSKDSGDIEHLAFVLMMVKLNGCNSCSSDSFRAMRGCTQCSLQNIRRYKENDKELIELYEKALIELKSDLNINKITDEAK